MDDKEKNISIQKDLVKGEERLFFGEAWEYGGVHDAPTKSKFT
ncbi:hypothetical protein GCM10007416_35400 [Kroppenstedtia guangzhouensis]|uniref:Uncharacterized protein n=1 Tax=Kroppenstedtia guangzhouensis TaxID=1274356 RepID=A0ABQ1H5C3_9BACL|nr:hypothetical protein [Kroppenstedtia guangzhouensis]GGA59209.1 hypothetical protein GCM10007416_35400 [Kroppenstedtia guangzhouensis]